MTEFEEAIYVQLNKVPFGKVTTYRDLAHSVGSNGYRAVGQAFH